MKNKQNALTLMEILVSAVILSLIFLGLLNLFISGRRYLQHSQSRMGGGELGKYFIDPLQMYVRQSDWGSSTNLLTSGVSTSVVYTINGLTYTATSTVTAIGTTGLELRRVKSNIVWTETQ